MQSKQIRSSFQKTVFPLIQRFTGIDQLGVTGEGNLLVGVIHHQITAGSPDGHIPSLFAHTVGHGRHHSGAGTGAVMGSKNCKALVVQGTGLYDGKLVQQD